MIGTHLGSYELLEELGKGGMAGVYRARQASMNRDVAVKVIHANLLDDVGRERFQREARLIARLEHPHILPVYDFDGNNDPPYIVMRYLPGGTLRDALARSGESLPYNVALHWFKQVASALDYAHEQGIIHRDLKPSNIIIDGSGNAFLTDFGIARFASEASLTASGAAVGTPAYMAPEQAMGLHDITGQADLYSLGVIAFELLTGAPPFASEMPMALMLKHIQEPPPRPTARNPRLPGAVDEVLLRALAKKPEERFVTAEAFVKALAVAFNLTATQTPAELQTVVTAPNVQKPGADVGATIITPTDQNKVVTVLYIDAAEYAQLVDETRGHEAARRAMRALWERTQKIMVERAGVPVVQGETECVVLWGAAATHEDDAERAVRAALDVQAAVRELGAGVFTESEDEPLPLKIGVNTGTVLLTMSGKNDAYVATGSSITLAQKLANSAEGIILISHDTFREVRGVFDMEPGSPMKVRGRKDLVPTYRVIAAKARAFRAQTHGIEGVETHLVGREAELKQLQNAYLNALEDSETQLVTVLGGAGIGKSRLLDEFQKWADLRSEEWRVFEGRATPEMTAAPYALWHDVFSFRFEILESDPPAAVLEKLERGVAELLRKADAEVAHLLGYLVGFEVSASSHVKGLLGDPQQLAARARRLFLRFFQRLGAIQLSVIQLEDLHHADDASLDLLTELATSHPDLPLVVFCLARPELLQRRSTWGSGQSFHTLVELQPLDKRASRDLVRELLQKMVEVPRELRDLLVDRSEGNPLFMEELVKMMLEDHVIVRDGHDGAWRLEAARLGQLRVPPSLSGLLQARFDTLLAPEKLTLQRAAVMGRVFYDTALQAIDAADDVASGGVHVTDLPGVLKRLLEREFIVRREPSGFAGSTEYLFVQSFLRDQIYATLVNRQLRVYHNAVANWLMSSERVDEFLPLIAEHYEKGENRTEARRALIGAGDRALQVSAYTDGLAFYQRALSLLPSTTLLQDSDRATLMLRLGEAYYRQGDYPAVPQALQEAQAAACTDAERAAALALLAEVTTEMGDYAGAQLVLEKALPLAQASGDQRTLSRTFYALGELNWRLGKLDDARMAFDECLVLARPLGDVTREVFALNRLGVVEFLQDHLAEAERIFQETLTRAMVTGNREQAALALNNLGEVEKERGDYTTARSHYQQALALSREFGTQQIIASFLINLADVDIRLGQIAEAPANLREGLRLALHWNAFPWVVVGVMYAGNLAHAEGQVERALALYGLARRHPAWDSEDQREMDAELARWGLDPAMVEAGLVKGAELDFDQTVQELLKEDHAAK